MKVDGSNQVNIQAQPQKSGETDNSAVREMIAKGILTPNLDPTVVPTWTATTDADGNVTMWALSSLFAEQSGNLQEAETRFGTALENVLAGSEGALDALKSLLGELGIGADLSELMVEFAAMGRQNALDQRLASREQAKNELMSQAETTRTSAVTQAIVAGVTLVASIASVGVSIGGAQSASKSADAMAKVTVDGSEQAQMAAINTAATATQASNQAQTQAINMTGQLAQGTGSVISGNIQADGQVDAANAQIEQSNSDLAKKVMDDFEEMVRASIQFLKEMQQAETDLMASMTRV